MPALAGTQARGKGTLLATSGPVLPRSGVPRNPEGLGAREAAGQQLPGLGSAPEPPAGSGLRKGSSQILSLSFPLWAAAREGVGEGQVGTGSRTSERWAGPERPLPVLGSRPGRQLVRLR